MGIAVAVCVLCFASFYIYILSTHSIIYFIGSAHILLLSVLVSHSYEYMRMYFVVLFQVRFCLLFAIYCCCFFSFFFCSVPLLSFLHFKLLFCALLAYKKWVCVNSKAGNDMVLVLILPISIAKPFYNFIKILYALLIHLDLFFCFFS